MRVISRKMLQDFAADEPEAAGPLNQWYRVAKKARWEKFADVRADYPSADMVGDLTVFNIGGNKYRLVVVIWFSWGRVYIRSVMTHKQYGKGDWKNDPGPQRPPREPENPKDEPR